LRAGVGGAFIRVVAAGGWLRGAVCVNGSVVFVKEVNHASPCEGHEDIFGGEGKFPQVPDDIEDAMSNGSSNDEGQAESSSSVPQVFSEVFLIGNSFGNKDKVEGEGWVWVADVDEVRDVLVALEELLDVVDGRGECVGLKLGGRHGGVGVGLRKAGWLSCKC